MLDVLIIGAGPVGLACALESQRKGLQVAIIEKGALVNSIVGYPTNMEFFSTPELLEIGGYPFPTAHYKPLREDALDYYQRVARDEKLTIRLHETVLTLEGEQGNFVVTTNKSTIPTRNVVVATGFYDLPNPLDVPGEDLPTVSHYYKEPYQHVPCASSSSGPKTPRPKRPCSSPAPGPRSRSSCAAPPSATP